MSVFIDWAETIGNPGEPVTTPASALRHVTGSASGPEPTIVIVKGYGRPNDHGGGVFYWDSTDLTTPDNGGTVIVPTCPVGTMRSGCWKRA